MKTPIGFVTATMIAKKKRIWNSPTAVMASSEALRPKQGVDQVDEDEHGGDAGNEVIHRQLPVPTSNCQPSQLPTPKFAPPKVNDLEVGSWSLGVGGRAFQRPLEAI